MLKFQNISQVMASELVILHGQVNIASNGTVSSLIGNGITSVTKDSTGVYSILLEKKFNRILNVVTSIESATSHNIVQVNEASNDGQTIVLNMFSNALALGTLDGYIDSGAMTGTVTSGAVTGTLTSGAITGTVTSGAMTGSLTSGAMTGAVDGYTIDPIDGYVIAGATFGDVVGMLTSTAMTGTLTSTDLTGTVTSTAMTGTLTSTALTGTLTSTALTLTGTASSSFGLSAPGADIILKFTVFAKDGSNKLTGEV